MPAAKELGQEYTRKELEEVAISTELSPDEIAGDAGDSWLDILNRSIFLTQTVSVHTRIHKLFP